MIILVYATMVLFGVGIGAIIFAVFSAKEGFQDQDGFHAIRRVSSRTQRQNEDEGGSPAKDENEPVPPPLHAH